MENFNLKKFLIENKLTRNSRMLSEEISDKDIQIGAEYTAMLATDTKGGRTPVKVKVLGRDRNDETKVIVTPLQDVDYKNAESGQMNRFTKGSHYGSESKYLSENGEQVNEAGMTLPIKNFLKMGEDEFKVNFTKFQNNSTQNGRSAVRNDGSFPVSVETDVQGRGPGGKFVINVYVTKDGNLDHIFLPGYDNSEVLVKQVRDWGPLRQYISAELAKTPATPAAQ